MEIPYTILLIGGMILLLAAILYASARNRKRHSAADIARTEAATHEAIEETDRETTD